MSMKCLLLRAPQPFATYLHRKLSTQYAPVYILFLGAYFSFALYKEPFTSNFQLKILLSDTLVGAGFLKTGHFEIS